MTAGAASKCTTAPLRYSSLTAYRMGGRGLLKEEGYRRSSVARSLVLEHPSAILRPSWKAIGDSGSELLGYSPTLSQRGDDMASKRLKRPLRDQQVNLRLDKETHDELMSLCEHLRVSQGSLVTLLVREKYKREGLGES